MAWSTSFDAMSSVESISLDTPQETRTFPHGEVQLVTVGGSTVGRFMFQPGWRWSTSVKPQGVTLFD